MEEKNYFGRQGWICPVCGRGLSPYTSFCPCKSDGSDRVNVTTTSESFLDKYPYTIDSEIDVKLNSNPVEIDY